MKKFTLILIIAGLFNFHSYAQTYWSASGSDIYNNNTGNVGIGTSSPVGLLTLSGTSSISSGTDNRFSIVPTINQTSTANYRSLWISPYRPSTGSGFHYLIDAGLNTAANGSGTHVSKFTLDDNGNVNVGARLCLGLMGTLSSSEFTITGGFNVTSNFSINGFASQITPATYTSTTSSGTVSMQGTSTFAIPVLAATNATTITNASTVYINGAPTAGTNMTITNPYALYVNAGNNYLGGRTIGFGGIQTDANSSTSNLFANNSGVISGVVSTSSILFGGASNVQFRSIFAGSASTTLAANSSYSNAIVGSSPLTTPATGTHALLANLVVNPIGTVTGGGATVTNTASLYVGGAASGGTNNYAIYSASGLNYFAGNVAINTPTMPAGYQFAVNGGIVATSVVVKLYSAWPDYVFKPQYKLSPLSQVKTYIDQNQHLPEIPSEKDIDKDGINLGEMNKLLLKKVEELTLYLIEQNKQLEKQKAIDQSLQEQINNLAKELKSVK